MHLIYTTTLFAHFIIYLCVKNVRGSPDYDRLGENDPQYITNMQSSFPTVHAFNEHLKYATLSPSPIYLFHSKTWVTFKFDMLERVKFGL